MKIFITGASGFIGGAIGTSLMSEHTVVAMARSERSAKQVKQLGLTPIRCSLNEVTKEDLKGCEMIIHSAAYVESWGTKAQFWTINVEGTRQLLTVGKEAGVKKFIFIGTEAALFHGQAMDTIDESYPYPKKTPYYYSLTKAAAEQLVLNANVSEVFETISLRPRLVWGPGDTTVLPELVKMIKTRSFMWINQGRALTSTTHISNFVEGVKCAIDHGRGGEVYFITDDEIISFKKFLTSLLATQEITPPNKSIAGGILSIVAMVIERIWRLFGIKKEPPITRFAADIMSVNCTININKARNFLRYTPVISIEDGMKELNKIGSAHKNSF